MRAIVAGQKLMVQAVRDQASGAAAGPRAMPAVSAEVAGERPVGDARLRGSERSSDGPGEPAPGPAGGRWPIERPSRQRAIISSGLTTASDPRILASPDRATSSSAWSSSQVSGCRRTRLRWTSRKRRSPAPWAWVSPIRLTEPLCPRARGAIDTSRGSWARWRGLRILRGFDSCPDRCRRGGISWEVLGELKEAVRTEPIPFRTQADIRLLQGQLDLSVAQENVIHAWTAIAEFLMDRTDKDAAESRSKLRGLSGA